MIRSFTRATGAVVVAAVTAAASANASAQTALPTPQDTPYLGTIALQVDATDLDHHVFRIKEQMPVRPGALVLFFPRFLPGTHGPTGEIDKLAGLSIKSGGVLLPWRRDTVDPYAFHLDVPAGASRLDIAFEFLSALPGGAGRVTMTHDIVNPQWNSLLLYPAGYFNTAITVQASLTVPAGWKQASALRVDSESNGTFKYKPVSLGTLVDSPVFAGANMKRIELDPPGTPSPIVLNIVADEASQLEASDEQIQAHRNLVIQADRLYGARHFAHYDFLFALSDKLGGIGLEHHESSENGVRPNYFKDWAKRSRPRDLLPHEFTHSWNGKFRRPADLFTTSFEVPMQDSLLWVYEGQTQFWGRVLAARSGLITLEQTRDDLANGFAQLDSRAGRNWRNLQDTTNEATMAQRRASKDWVGYQRGSDYYEEATFIWLDADTLIRELSNNTKSMDDFARAFFGVQNFRVQPLTYTFEDVVATLNAVQPYDWAKFLRDRLDTNQPGAPGAGLTRAGWRLAWADKPSEFQRSADPGEMRDDDYSYSVGMTLRRDGTVTNVQWNGPAYTAGLAKSVQIIAVNSMAYKPERLAAGITANQGGKDPIELLVKDAERFRTVRLDYRDGLRYPRLERIPGTVERLDAGLLAARNAP